MQDQHKPVLIFAQSGRFLAQSATQAGYRVWVADCFGDQETFSVAERWQQLPRLSENSSIDVLDLLSTLSQGEECSLIYGSGIELTYTMLAQLPRNIQLIGNEFNTVHTVQTPQLFFKLLTQLKLRFPETTFKKPEDSSNWLVKSSFGMGGEHIQHLNSAHIQTKHYFQRHISGLPGSALFLANGSSSQLISINKQVLSENPSVPFQLSRIDNNWLISAKHQGEIQLAIDKIVIKIALRGINSLDFIISQQDELFILEVNPRPSASADLVADKATLFQQHIDACQGILPNPAITPPEDTVSLYYIYAANDLIIPKDMKWPLQCFDIPIATSLIPKGGPICTSIVTLTKQQDVQEVHKKIEKQVLDQLLLPA